MIKDLTLEGPQEVPGRAGPATKYPSRLGVLHFMESQEFYKKRRISKRDISYHQVSNKVNS